MEQGFIFTWRKMMETSFYKKPLVCHLAHHCILKANFRDKKTIFNGQDILIKRGSFITGRKQLSMETGLSQQNVRSALKVLRNIGFLTIKSTNRFSIVSVMKYDDYQSSSQSTNQQTNQQLTNKQPTTNQQVTTTNNNKNIKNKKNRINITATEVRNWFNKFWEQYPRKLYKKATMPVFFEKIRDDRDWENVQVALTNYNKSKDVEDGTIMNAYNWLDSYEDWIYYREPKKKSSKLKAEDL